MTYIWMHISATLAAIGLFAFAPFAVVYIRLNRNWAFVGGSACLSLAGLAWFAFLMLLLWGPR